MWLSSPDDHRFPKHNDLGPGVHLTRLYAHSFPLTQHPSQRLTGINSPVSRQQLAGVPGQTHRIFFGFLYRLWEPLGCGVVSLYE